MKTGQKGIKSPLRQYVSYSFVFFVIATNFSLGFLRWPVSLSTMKRRGASNCRSPISNRRFARHRKRTTEPVFLFPLLALLPACRKTFLNPLSSLTGRSTLGFFWLIYTCTVSAPGVSPVFFRVNEIFTDSSARYVFLSVRAFPYWNVVYESPYPKGNSGSIFFVSCQR